MKEYFVYIMTNRSGTLYVGVTNNLMRRVYEHKNKLLSGFTKRYKIDRLVYFSQTNHIHSALREEKRIKGWLRAKKVALIESTNPHWVDLAEYWFEKIECLSERSERAPVIERQEILRRFAPQDDNKAR